jgi:hypothetical protein
MKECNPDKDKTKNERSDNNEPPRPKSIDNSQVIKCIVEVSGVRMKVVAAHMGRGRFKILSTSVYDYRHFVGTIIDASQVCEVIL